MTTPRFGAVAALPSFKAIVLLVLVAAAALVFQPLAIESYGITLTRVNEVAIVAVGLTLLILIGEIDLSVGSTMAVAGIIACQISDQLWLGVLGGLAAGVVIGAINGFLVVVVGVHSFIATLGTMTILAGVALLLSAGNPVILQDFDATRLIGTQVVGQLTFASIVVLVLVLITWALLHWSRAGRDLHTIGGNPDAARAAGIHVALRRFGAFVACGLFAAVAGILSTIQVASASPMMGAPVLLTAIASAVLGGGVLTGGRGSVIGAAVGALALGILRSSLELAAVGDAVEQILIGVILFVTVITSGTSPAGGRLQAVLRHFGGGSSRPSRPPSVAGPPPADGLPSGNPTPYERGK